MKIKFLPQNIEVEGTPNKSLLQIATENQLEIRSICKGVPSCAECRVKIAEGENNILPPNKAELNLIGTNYFIDGRRLSCQVRCFGDVTVDLTEQVEKSESQTKKIRGYRAPGKQMESHAVNDTMLLNEKIEVTEDRHQEDRPQQQQGQQQQRKPQHQNQQKQQAKGQGKQQNQQQNRPKQQQKNQNQNQQKKRR
ncbi:2Fe-2S ferredoxin-5 [compost metagenome]